MAREDVQHIINNMGNMGMIRSPAFLHPDLTDVLEGRHAYYGRYGMLFFIVSEEQKADGLWWLHVSVSRSDRKMPTYYDLATAKRICMGEHRTAFHLFVPPEQHIDFAGRMAIPTQVLHLWSPEINILPNLGGP